MKDYLAFCWSRVVCFFRGHRVAGVVGSAHIPGTMCFQVVCTRCGKEVGHFHLPTNNNDGHRERMH